MSWPRQLFLATILMTASGIPGWAEELPTDTLPETSSIATKGSFYEQKLTRFSCAIVGLQTVVTVKRFNFSFDYERAAQLRIYATDTPEDLDKPFSMISLGVAAIGNVTFQIQARRFVTGEKEADKIFPARITTNRPLSLTILWDRPGYVSVIVGRLLKTEFPFSRPITAGGMFVSGADAEFHDTSLIRAANPSENCAPAKSSPATTSP